MAIGMIIGEISRSLTAIQSLHVPSSGMIRNVGFIDWSGRKAELMQTHVCGIRHDLRCAGKPLR